MKKKYIKLIILLLMLLWIQSLTYANDNEENILINNNSKIENKKEVYNIDIFNTLNNFYFKYRNYNLSYNETLLSISTLNIDNDNILNKNIIDNYIWILKLKIDNIENIRTTIFNILYIKIKDKVLGIINNLSEKDKINILTILNQKVDNLKSIDTFNKELLLDKELNKKEKNIIKYNILIKILEDSLNKKRD